MLCLSVNKLTLPSIRLTIQQAITNESGAGSACSFADELEEAAHSLRNLAFENRLALLADLRLLGNETDAVEIHVRAGNDADVGLAFFRGFLICRWLPPSSP